MFCIQKSTADKSYYEKFADGTVKCIDDEIPFEIPESWEWCRLGSIISLISGQDFPPNKYNSSEEGIPYIIGASNIIDGMLQITRWTTTPSVLANQSDLLLVCKGAGVGKMCMCDVSKAHIARQIQAIRVYSNLVSIEYIKHILTCRVDDIISKANGLIPGLNRELILDFFIPLPAYNEQKRINQNIRNAFALIESIDFNKVDLSKIIKQAKSKILDLAIRGKLVPQDPNDEPASVLLKRIKAEHVEGKKKAKNISDNSHYAFNIPKSWIWCDICDVCDVSPKNKIDDEVDVSFIPMTLITEGFSNKHRSETRKWGKVKKGFTHFRDDDVGIAKITPCFENRKSVVFKDLENQYGAGTTELHILRPISKYLSSAYILWFVKTDNFITNGISCFTGAVGQQRVGSSFVKETGFPLPPANEQKRIVKRIEEIFTSLDKIENLIKA